jgi:hypothetical protein
VIEDVLHSRGGRSPIYKQSIYEAKTDHARSLVPTVLTTTTTTTTTATTTTIIAVGVLVPLAMRLGPFTPAIAHSLSTPIHLGGLPQQPRSRSTSTSLHHPTSCSALHQYSPHLFLTAHSFLPGLCAPLMCGKNNLDFFSCSHSSLASNDSLEHSLLDYISCESHLFNAYSS